MKHGNESGGHREAERKLKTSGKCTERESRKRVDTICRRIAGKQVGNEDWERAENRRGRKGMNRKGVNRKQLEKVN